MRSKQLLILKGYKKELRFISEKKYISSRLQAEANRREGIRVMVVGKYDLSMEISRGKVSIKIGELPLESYDYLIILSNFSSIFFGSSLIRICKGKNIRVLNFKSFEQFTDNYTKLAQMVCLAHAGIPVPDTTLCISHEKMLKQCDGKHILKTIRGSEGSDVTLATKEAAEVAFESHRSEDIILQELLPNRMDYRVIILGGRSLGIMERKAAEGCLVSNYSAGGLIRSVKNQKIAELAVKAAKVLDCEYAGVDIMLDKRGKPVVLEVNRNAQFEGFEKVTGVNVAGKIIDYLIICENKKNRKL